MFQYNLVCNKFQDIYTNEKLNEQIQSVKINSTKKYPNKFRNIYTNKESDVSNKQIQSLKIDNNVPNNNLKDNPALLNKILKHIKIEKTPYKHLTSMSFK